MQPSPNGRRVGIRIVTFEACSGFTHVTARWTAPPPKATFVTRLQPRRLTGRLPTQRRSCQCRYLSTAGTKKPSGHRRSEETVKLPSSIKANAKWREQCPVLTPKRHQ